jgi:hypothetical protein
VSSLNTASAIGLAKCSQKHSLRVKKAAKDNAPANNGPYPAKSRNELSVELLVIQARMTQKPLLRVEVVGKSA